MRCCSGCPAIASCWSAGRTGWRAAGGRGFRARGRPLLGDAEQNRQTADPAAYAELLAKAGCEVDAWETTYVHILEGNDPVLEWYKGTGLRPLLAVLDADQAADFLAEYGERLREAYPPRSFGTVFPFRRVFTVARRAKKPGFSY